MKQNSLNYDSLRVGDVVFVRYLCNGFIRSFEGICLVKGKSIILRGNLLNEVIELVFFRFGCCVLTFVVLNFKRKFVRCSRSRLFFIRRKSKALSFL